MIVPLEPTKLSHESRLRLLVCQQFGATDFWWWGLGVGVRNYAVMEILNLMITDRVDQPLRQTAKTISSKHWCCSSSQSLWPLPLSSAYYCLRALSWKPSTSFFSQDLTPHLGIVETSSNLMSLVTPPVFTGLDVGFMGFAAMLE